MRISDEQKGGEQSAKASSGCSRKCTITVLETGSVSIHVMVPDVPTSSVNVHVELD
jgi:hypothetical protein